MPGLGSGPIAPAAADRLDLGDGAWVDIWRGFLEHAEETYAALADLDRWRHARLFRYETTVEEPRLTSTARVTDPDVPRTLVAAHRRLQHRYRVRFDGFALAWYRDGRDGIAFHRDTDMRWLDDTLIAVLSLGVTRPFRLRPRAHRNRHDLALAGATHDLAPASGDLIVMGGSCQRDWEHAVPRIRDLDAGRMSVQWRWSSRRGRPFIGAGYRAPVHFGH